MANDSLRPILPTTKLSTDAPAVDFALVLDRVITSARDNPAELRNAIYELARVKLDQEAKQSDPPIDQQEWRRLAAALEIAIERVEAISSQEDDLKAFGLLGNHGRNPPLIPSQHTALHVPDGLDGRISNQVPVLSAGPGKIVEPVAYETSAVSSEEMLRSRFVRTRLVPALLVCLATIGGFSIAYLGTRQSPSGNIDTSRGKTDFVREVPLVTATAPSRSERDQARGFPLPDVYGIYAISNGKLFELDALPFRAPDQRIFMSATISKPSHTTIPDGSISFLAYRRELVTNAPDRVSVRVIAQVMRTMTVEGGKARVIPVDETWAIRNVEHVFRVAPLSENSEMLLIRSDIARLNLSPGRYAIILNGLPYDFTVAGKVTETAHCLERTVAGNGTFYSECRNP